LIALPLLVGCQFTQPEQDWTDQLHADGPCFRANLLDGLDEESTGELHDLFACVNSTGAMDGLSPLDRAMDGETRQGAAGLVIARLVNDLPSLDLGLSTDGMLDAALELLADPEPVLRVGRLAAELAYARPWSELAADYPLNAQSSLDDGVVVPMLPVLGRAAGTLLDGRLAALKPAISALQGSVLDRVVWTASAVFAADSGPAAELADGWAEALAEALERAESPENDRFAGLTGNSVRDLVFALVDDGDGTDLLSALQPLLQDDAVRADTLRNLQRVEADEGFTGLAVGALHLVEVDARGESLEDEEPSALFALLRLLHDANTSVDCSIDLYVATFDFSFGNLAVAILEALAETDPDTVDTGVSLLGAMLAIDLTDDILDAVADSGVCPAIDADFVSDLHAIDRLADGESGPLLAVLLAALDGFGDHIPELLDAIDLLYERQLIWPIEELVRDLGDGTLLELGEAMLPVLLEPGDFLDDSSFPAGVELLDLEALWSVLADAEIGDLEVVREPLQEVVAADATWTALDHLASLLVEPDAELRTLPDDLPDLLAADPELGWADSLATMLAEDRLVEPALVLAECTAMQDALGTTAITEEGPLPFSVRLIASGTVEAIAGTIATLKDLATESP
jgi:hypothetical protein